MKRIVLGISDNPNSILSYGILMDYLTKTTSHKYQWNVMVNGFSFGKPEIYPHYMKWPSGRDKSERNMKYVPKMIDKLSPEFVFSIGDWQYFINFKRSVPSKVPWIHWLPIDHEDSPHLIRALYTVKTMDIPILMSKYAMDFLRGAGLVVEDYLYPFIQTDEFRTVDNTFDGFRKIKRGTEDHKKLMSFKKVINPDDKQMLLFIGRPGWRKNLQILLGVFSELINGRERKDVMLYLHTDINDPASTFNIGKEIHAQRIPHKSIRFTKIIEWDVGAPKWFLRGLYNLADIFISAHGGEGFGMPIAESMACGTPFIATNCTTTPELGKSDGIWKRGLGVKIAESHEDRGVIRPYVDIHDFCDKIEYLLDHPQKRRTMGKNGRSWVVENCSIPVIQNKVLKILEKTETNKAVIKYD